MNKRREPLNATREAVRIGGYLTSGRPGALPPVVQDDVAVTGGAHAVARHCPDNADDQGLVDGDAEGVVRVEAHDRPIGVHRRGRLEPAREQITALVRGPSW